MIGKAFRPVFIAGTFNWLFRTLEFFNNVWHRRLLGEQRHYDIAVLPAKLLAHQFALWDGFPVHVLVPFSSSTTTCLVVESSSFNDIRRWTVSLGWVKYSYTQDVFHASTKSGLQRYALRR
jgi:hypothetical protein